jgi:release factor glutamine methyltransferase
MTIQHRRELLEAGKDILRGAGNESFGIGAELLLCHVLGTDKISLFLNPLTEVNDVSCAQYLDLVRRVAAGEPLQYVTGEAYFMGHRFAVSPAVLIPRPETEVLCGLAIQHLKSFGGASAPAVLDLCTGSGALAISIALAVPAAHLTASDISPRALAVARANADALGVSARIDFRESDLFADLPPSYDLIVTNPPYIRSGDIPGLPREVRCEPALALDGGADGLAFYRRIAAEAGAFLTDGGTLLAEIGWDQEADVKAAFEAAGFSDLLILKDLTARDRIVRARKR